MLAAIAVAVTVLRSQLPEVAAELATTSRTRAIPLPAHATPGDGGCVETGMRVVIGCGGCTATSS